MISVCIATYNGERFIRQQIESIIHQLTLDDEIVISDDASTDSTLDIIRSLQSPIIHVFTNYGRHGYTPNFENAIRHAQGDYIFLSDQDDVWQPHKIEICMRHFKHCDFIISDASLINADNQIMANSFFALRKSRPGFIANLVRFSYLGCCIAFHRRILDRALPFPTHHDLCTHDNWLTLIAMAYYKTSVIKKKLILYRRYDKNTSTGGLLNNTSMKFKITYRLYLIWWLIIRGCKHNG